MPKVSMTQNLNVSADQLWQMIGHFNALPDWHPAVEQSELCKEGETRTLSLAGGGKIVEKLEASDHDSKTYTYSIVDSPLPVKNYLSTIKVSGSGDNATVEWSSEFEAAGMPDNDATKAIEGIYQAGLDNLRKMFGG